MNKLVGASIIVLGCVLIALGIINLITDVGEQSLLRRDYTEDRLESFRIALLSQEKQILDGELFHRDALRYVYQAKFYLQAGDRHFAAGDYKMANFRIDAASKGLLYSAELALNRPPSSNSLGGLEDEAREAKLNLLRAQCYIDAADLVFSSRPKQGGRLDLGDARNLLTQSKTSYESGEYNAAVQFSNQVFGSVRSTIRDTKWKYSIYPEQEED